MKFPPLPNIGGRHTPKETNGYVKEIGFFIICLHFILVRKRRSVILCN